jgi:hypothetical protein
MYVTGSKKWRRLLPKSESKVIEIRFARQFNKTVVGIAYFNAIICAYNLLIGDH